MGDFRIQSTYARKKGREYGDPKTIDEAKEWAEEQREVVPSVAPPEIGDDDELWQLALKIALRWPKAEVLFGGGPRYIDTMYVQYGDIDSHKESEFRECMVLHFKHWMDEDPEDNEGICPTCDDRVDTSHEMFRDDDNLWARPDEFDFREYPDYGKVCRMWWD